MKRKRLSLNEMSWLFFGILVVGLLLSFVREWFFWIGSAPIALWAVKYYILKFISRKLPGKSIYRTNKLIEIHMGNVANGDVDLFLSEVAKSILYSHTNQIDCVFYTFHYSPKAIKRLLGKNVIIHETTGFERFAQLFWNQYYADYVKKHIKINPLSRVYIHWRDLNSEDIIRLKSKVLEDKQHSIVSKDNAS